MEAAKNTIRSFKDLIVWQRSMDLAVRIYGITQKLPASEQFGLTSQLRRAAVSIPSNIAEGYGRQSTGYYRQFLSISRGSLMEIETQINICDRLKYVAQSDTENIFKEITEISKMLTSLISKIR
jgi:four helix bundle protein